jgi:hypothetical protein
MDVSARSINEAFTLTIIRRAKKQILGGNLLMSGLGDLGVAEILQVRRLDVCGCASAYTATCIN